MSSMRRHIAAGGFTLVELLVAVLAFGLLASAAYTGLNRLSASAAQLDARAADLAALQRAVAAIDQDLRQLVSRAARGPDGSLRPALSGARDRFSGHRSGRWVPDERSGSVIQTVGWACTGDGLLERRAGADAGADLPVGPDPGAWRHAVGCQRLELRYRDTLGQWHATWPSGARPEQLPQAVEYTLVTETWGEIQRLVAL